MTRSTAYAITALLLLASAPVFPQAGTPVEEPRFNVTGFVIEGDNPLPAASAQAVLAPFTGTHTGIERLQQAAGALEETLRERGFGFYRVVLPPQDIGGTIRLQIFKFPLGKVEIKGNRHFDNDNILRGLPQLRSGETPNTQALARDLAVSNENPSKRVNVTFKQGEASDTIDAAVEVNDSRPWSGFAVLANTGTPATGRNRLTVGATHSNLFDRDHQATFTYTTSPSEAFNRVKQYGGFYRIPVYALGGMVSAYYTYSSASSGLVANSISVTGRGRFAGVQYTHYLPPVGDYRSYMSVGFDDKLFLNDQTTFGSTPFAPNYRTNPLTLSYTGRFEKKWGLWGYKFDYVRNLPLGNGNSSAAYAFNDGSTIGVNRAGAHENWDLLRFGADATVALPFDWLFNFRFNGQHSMRRLLVPGEQFGVGGAQSVRGLEERLVAGDSGFTANFEAWTPELAAGTRMLFFYDHGRIALYQALPGTIAGATLASIGVGVRWNFGTTLAASLDFAHVVQGLADLLLPTSVPKAPDKLHFNLMVRF